MLRPLTMPRTPYLALSVVLGSLVTGCGPSLYQKKILAAKEARARGDLAAEALAWRSACQIEPDDKETCTNAKRTAEALTRKSLEGSAPACQRGDLTACAKGLSDLRVLTPNNPEALALLREAERLHAKTCATLDAKGTASMMLVRWGCFANVARLVDDPAYEAMLQEERAHQASGFLTLGRSGPHGASFVFNRSAQCFSRGAGEGAVVQASADAFLRAAALPITVRTRAGGASLLPGTTANACSSIAEALGPRAYCSRGAPVAPDLALDLGLTLGGVDHRVATEMRVATYVSGVETYPNPNRPAAEAEVDRAQSAFQAIEQEALDREARCNRTRTPAACDHYNAIVPTYNQRQQALANARQHLANTPPTLTREIIARVEYPVRHHTWSVPYSVLARSLAGAEAHREGVFERRDSETTGVAVAGVAADPLVVPRIEDFNGELARIARAVGASVADLAFKQRATCAGEPWNLDDVERLDCRARSELYTTGALPRPESWNVDCR